MSKVFNMVGGGGGKNISSIIITGLESTDTVTCTKDGMSYTATWDSTAQHWEIVGLPLGTFTVTATNGTKTKTETVLIDIAGVYEVEMIFKLWLYRDGDPCEDVTGGWSYYSTNSNSVNAVTLNETNIALEPYPAGKNTGVTMNKYVDVTNYAKAYFEFERTNTLSSTNNYWTFSIVDSSGEGVTSVPTDDGIIYVDISALDGFRTVKVWLYSMYIKITKIWLE